LHGWREYILSFFQEPLPSLFLVSDPDGLLKDERIYTSLNRRSVEIVEVGDPIAFRYLYELKYREAVNAGRIRLVVRTEQEAFQEIPYDLLRLGRRLSFRLADLFPKLNPLVVKELGPQDLEILYEVYPSYQGGNSLSETSDFLLRKVFKLPYDLIENQTDLVRFLLSKHYQGQRYPETLQRYLVEKLETIPSLRGLPLNELLESEHAFYEYLQEEWAAFLTTLQENTNKIKEVAAESDFQGEEHPFTDQEVRRLLDDLFVEGKLKPLAGYNSKLLPPWTHVGLVIDRQQDQKLRLQGLLAALEKHLQPEMTYKDWQRIAAIYGEAKHLLLSMELPAKDQLALGWQDIDQRINQQFTVWMLEFYHGLKNLPYLPEPVMVHHIPHYLAAKFQSKVALVVMDGMNYAQWVQIRETLEKDPDFQYDLHEQNVYAWAPTITSVSRQAIFNGEIPMYFSDSIHTTAKEPAAWQLFWENHQVMPVYTFYGRVLEQGAGEWRTGANKDLIKVCGLVIDIIDRLMHNSLQGHQSLYVELALWLKKGLLQKLLVDLLEAGFDLYLTSDHGNQESRGIGRISEGVLAETCGQRVRVYPDQETRARAAEKNGALTWPGDGLPEGYYVLMAKSGESFTKEQALTVSHGGISIEEVIVPFVHITKKQRKEAAI
jgi:hypothetical protein